jgi:hypothetical protein
MGRPKTGKLPDFVTPTPKVEDFAYQDRLGNWHGNYGYVSKPGIEASIAPKTEGEALLRGVADGVLDPFRANRISKKK